MPSTSQLTSNSRSMNGLNTINANAVFTDSLEVGTLQIDTQGTAPTRTLGDNTTNIATTQFVQSAVGSLGSTYVNISGTQTITGEKTFDNATTYINGTLYSQDIANNGYIDTGSINTNTINSLSGTTVQVNDSLVLNSGNLYSPLGTSMLISSAGLTDTLTLIGGNTIDLIGITTIDGTLSTNGQTSSGSIMTNTYNPFLATNDVNINPTQTSGSLNLGTKIDRSGIIQIGNGLNATCDIRIGTSRNTGGAVSIGSNNSIANTLNLQSALINIGTGSPIGTANTINIGNGNTGSLIDLNNDTTITGATTITGTTNINITGTSATSIGNLSGGLTLSGLTQTLTSAGVQNLSGTTQNTDATTQINQKIAGITKVQITNNTVLVDAGTTFQVKTNGSITRQTISSSGIVNSIVSVNSGLIYPINQTSANGYFTSTTSTTKFTNASANLASITIGTTPGCYLVEGQFYFSGAIFTPQVFTTISLSTTSATPDTTRQITAYQGGISGNYAQHITSIFNVNSATTFYLVGIAQNTLGATATQSNYLSITKIA